MQSGLQLAASGLEDHMTDYWATAALPKGKLMKRENTSRGLGILKKNYKTWAGLMWQHQVTWLVYGPVNPVIVVKPKHLISFKYIVVLNIHMSKLKETWGM